MISVITLVSCTSQSKLKSEETKNTDFTSVNILDCNQRIRMAVSCEYCDIYFQNFVFPHPDQMSQFANQGIPVSIVEKKIAPTDDSFKIYTYVDTFEHKFINDTIHMGNGGYIAYYDAMLIGFNQYSDTADHSEE